jgi:hypothetical protein
MNSLTLTKQVKQYYRQNIDKILSYREQSGKYRLNPAKVEEWIRSQHTPIRQEACRKLISKVHYFTYGETFDLFFEVVSKMRYLKDKTIYILIDKQGNEQSAGQSGFMFALLGYHALMNILDIQSRDINFTYEILPNSKYQHEEYVFFDDFSYSGSQLMQVINELYSEYLKNKKLSFNFCLLGASKFSASQIIIKPTRVGRSYWRAPSAGNLPDNFKFNIGRIIDRYDENLTPEEKNNIRYFFDPLETYGKTLVYFDHKIADDVSTLLNVLKFGLVIPENYYIKPRKGLKVPEMEPAGSGKSFRAVHLIDECEHLERPYIQRVKEYMSFIVTMPKDDLPIWIDEIPDSKEEQQTYMTEKTDEMEMSGDVQMEIVELYIELKDMESLNIKQYFKDRMVISSMKRCPVSFYKEKGILKREQAQSITSSRGRSSRQGSTMGRFTNSIKRGTRSKKSHSTRRKSRSTRRKSL